MSVLFNDARFSTRARPRSRSTTGLWLSVMVHATFAVVLIVVPIRASEKPSTPRPRSISVFRWAATKPIPLQPLRSIPVAAPRLPSPPVPVRPVHAAVIADVPKPGLDRAASAPAQSPGAAIRRAIDRLVEIVFKPTREYTDEARSARIEGTVTLELEFTAAGDVRVLRVVRGLGHGLDEAAERAALRIRFKPAQSSDGRAVDSRATVHITFRLS